MTRSTIDLGTRREFFWDDYLVQPELTTAFPRLIQPVWKGAVFWFDHELDIRCISYPLLLKAEDGYRMYYVGWQKGGISRLLVLTSPDGMTWTRPNLGIHSYNGSTDNNIVMDVEDFRDNMFIFRDTNPACPKDEWYKAVCRGTAECEDGVRREGLWCLVSEDGYRFRRSHLMTVKGVFDTMNTAFWDGSRYVCYIRNYHNIPPERISGGMDTNGVWDLNERKIPTEDMNKGIRVIRVMYSDDFKNWTEPKLLQFRDGEDIPLYTNVISQYDRAPHVRIGFPTRYCERPGWSPNFEQLSGVENRREAVFNTSHPREGLAITDCIFMWSRDGENWDRSLEAFMTPGYEHDHNWVYGDCYPSYGFLDTGDETLSLYTIDYHRSYDAVSPMNRYEIRKDGFACYRAGGKEAGLVTKPLTFTGSRLHLNFASSAFGYIYAEVLDVDGNPISGKSFEIFGDTIDREIFFADGTDFSQFANRPVRLRFTMRDAKLFSMWFE